ncbi:hypothetical protein HK098_002423, partial [Nowakowskiella sp. JEL0407]
MKIEKHDDGILSGSDDSGVDVGRNLADAIATNPQLDALNKFLNSIDIERVSFGDQIPTLTYSPFIEINGFGLLPIPVQDCHAKLLWNFMSKNKRLFGSVVDNNTWRLSAKFLKINNEVWDTALVENLVKSVAVKMECNDKDLRISFEHVLVRGPGSQLPLGSVKSAINESFATLIIQLPSLVQGGEFTVSNNDGRTRTFDFGQSSGNQAVFPHYLVCYADEKAEMKEISSGYKVDLVYSIIRTEKVTKKTVKQLDIKELVKLVNRIGNQQLLYICKHNYTESQITSLGVAALQGIDETRAQAINSANQLLPVQRRLKFYITLTSRTVFSHKSSYDGCGCEKQPKDPTVWHVEKEVYEFRNFWYSESGVCISKGDKVEGKRELFKIKLDTVLNPDLANSKELFWGDKVCSSSRYHDYGIEYREDRYDQYAIIAWPSYADTANLFNCIDSKSVLNYLTGGDETTKGAILKQILIDFEKNRIVYGNAMEVERFIKLILGEVERQNNVELSTIFIQSCFNKIPRFDSQICMQIYYLMTFKRLKEKLIKEFKVLPHALAFNRIVEFCTAMVYGNQARHMVHDLSSLIFDFVPIDEACIISPRFNDFINCICELNNPGLFGRFRKAFAPFVLEERPNLALLDQIGTHLRYKPSNLPDQLKPLFKARIEFIAKHLETNLPKNTKTTFEAELLKWKKLMGDESAKKKKKKIPVEDEAEGSK